MKTLVQLYAKHRVLAELIMGLIQSIRPLNPPLIGQAAAENWPRTYGWRGGGA